MAETSVDWRARAGSAVCRPAFVGAVAVLLVNDHLLKGAGLLPAWLTGKLSDVAGLFFFPVLLAVLATYLLRARDGGSIRRYSAGAAAATVGVFSVVNLSPPLAAALSELWGSWTADPTDLLCLPFAVSGHIWFVHHVGASVSRPRRRLPRVAMVLLAAVASLATSKNTPAPEFELQNETDESLAFVESPAEVVYGTADPGIARARIDGEGETDIVTEGMSVLSMSRTGETIALKGEERPHLYREGASTEVAPLRDVGTLVDRAAVSPDGNWVAVVYGEYREDRDNLDHLHVFDTGNLETVESRTESVTSYSKIGWTADSSALYFQPSEQEPARYTPADGRWESVDSDSFDWTELHRPHYRGGNRCDDGSGLRTLEDPAADGNFDDYEGLEIEREDGGSEVLVEIEVTEEIEDPDEYSSPFEDYMFVRGCDYVVFQMADDPTLRVVGVESKQIGPVAEMGEDSRIELVPEFRPETP